MDNRFYLKALGITGLCVGLLILFWIASGGQAASDSEVQSANNTRTAIAMTGAYLLQPRTRTPEPLLTPTTLAETTIPGATPTLLTLPSPTSTSLFTQFSTPISPAAPSLTALPTQTAAAQIPAYPTTASGGRKGVKAPPVMPQVETPAAIQDPAGFARWYFARVWNERDYQNLWDHYLTTSYKTNVGSGLFPDYVAWWDSVERVEVNSADVLQNNGQDALVRVNLTFYMKDGRVVQDQAYEYDFRYDPARGTWMFDSSP